MQLSMHQELLEELILSTQIRRFHRWGQATQTHWLWLMSNCGVECLKRCCWGKTEMWWRQWTAIQSVTDKWPKKWRAPCSIATSPLQATNQAKLGNTNNTSNSNSFNSSKIWLNFKPELLGSRVRIRWRRVAALCSRFCRIGLRSRESGPTAATE